ncbi:MAG: nicotinate-nucleotide diphosphorylase [Candidatus Omnitrophica bacterium]|nr:nicotinate-nucleotide diphosphorylase [Candidatus Omnitrophota bacterium]
MIKLSGKTINLIREALREDLGRGDVTTKTLIPQGLHGEAQITAKSNGIVCGSAIVKEVFRLVDSALKVEGKVQDGSRISKGRRVISICGPVASILQGERLALNFLGYLSGISTLTAEFVHQIQGTRAKIYDTRKTTPLWRELEKYAVKVGGGENHRFGLWDEMMVKDNHWTALSSLSAKNRTDPCLAGRQASSGGRSNLRTQKLLRVLRTLTMTAKRRKIPVEIEVDTLKQLRHLLDGNFRPNRVLLDNFSVRELRRAVAFVKQVSPKIQLEASGGVTLNNVRKIAKTGVDRVSIGALTHSASALDFSLKIVKVRNDS